MGRRRRCGASSAARRKGPAGAATSRDRGRGPLIDSPCTHHMDSRELAVEVEGSRERLEAVGVPRPRAFAYPYGRHDAAVVSAVKRAGFRIAFSTESGVVTPRPDGFLVPRLGAGWGVPGFRFRGRFWLAPPPPVGRRAARFRA